MENNKLKKLLADKLLEVEVMKDVLSKKMLTPTAPKAVVRQSGRWSRDQ